MSNLIPYQDIYQMAEAAAKSKLFGFRTPEEAVAIMVLCQAEGLHPGIAMRDYHIIQGRPALKSDAMLARFQQSGGSVKWEVYTDEEVTGLFSHPQGGSLAVTWTLAHAKKIGIATKDNWKNYPRAMLRARCISEGIRAVFPGAVVGVYTPEEVQDFAPEQKPAVKDMGPVEVIEESDGAFCIYVPGTDQPFSRHDTVDAWIKAYADLAARVWTSPKMSDEDKATKVKGLAEANKAIVDGFSPEERIRIKSELVKAGVTTNPKSQQSPPSANEELNESAS